MIAHGSNDTPWPQLVQNLRASCETDWVEEYPAHVVAPWLGHSPKVAAQHYLMSREHNFEDVVKGESKVPAAIVGEDPNGVAACDANCDAIATRIATPQASAQDGTEPHETTEPAATTRVTAGSSEVTPVSKTGLVAGAGFERMGFPSGKPVVPSACDAECDALSAGRLELLARAVLIVAKLPVSEAERSELDLPPSAIPVSKLGIPPRIDQPCAVAEA